MSFFDDPVLMNTFSITGAALILIAFIASNFGRMKSDSFVYGALNCSGTALLAFTVVKPLNVGLLVVEVVWCVASFFLCLKALKKPSPTSNR